MEEKGQLSAVEAVIGQFLEESGVPLISLAKRRNGVLKNIP